MSVMTWHIRGQHDEYSTEGEALAAAWAMTAPGAVRPEVYELTIPPPPGAEKKWVRFEDPTIVGRDEDNHTIVTVVAWGVSDDMPAHIATLPFDSQEWRNIILGKMRDFLSKRVLRYGGKSPSRVVWIDPDSYRYETNVRTWTACATFSLAWLGDD